ncbi:GMP synthase (glutamine-hydrolyzing) [Streptoalloteichus tenebrarius]|uniref:GMP synthase (Glutamine-hydrolyzing) n=1 Tax=Streptoalloteichus tenebrarius (strain ATCC 17920 / DSM 40477 / JCM 4838 / CBS 697.72 / NBRC 16177 / NCIMB 11028 / NRRL B-12390 / A12253. 1 / ISP 5477) TaxID=1933 RepID=A0ABT1HYW3_STRSD|nr:type 1 glutamine amidotransferase [Streptoalloteichus tenebrarius]MCP2260718.1 GMP synthase (glutamine-hydrolyzing) [Streptoalloteichus tenebrarius]BFF03748.1 type 1 glutamine amidotransferase [Streptoalloteichus tenebrarius]
MTPTRHVLILRHVPWEGPGLIATALDGLPVLDAVVVDDHDPRLPTVDQLCGLVVMGGPMNADDTARHPGLAAERRLLAAAVEAGVPALGVCLGGQLLARALDAPVHAGAGVELGWAPITVTAQDDPLLGGLAPASPVLHWHSDVFEAPSGATPLAATDTTPCQAFRLGSAWGLQFHVEVTRPLLDEWLAEPTMAGEAAAALGPDWRRVLTEQTDRHLDALAGPALRGLAAFAELVHQRR